jgi:hypothetical protein
MSEPSGPQWCPRFPTSSSLDDLTPDFGDRARAFISALKRGGATVSVAATYRPPERAYLMHWCCMIGGSGQDPATVPKMAGVDIDWTCGHNFAAAKTAARAMMAKYDIQFPAALVSRHTQRRAIDMTIAWTGTLKIIDFDGVTHTIASSPKNGSNAELIAAGKSFGVIKLPSDPPHWSDDGH